MEVIDGLLRLWTTGEKNIDCMRAQSRTKTARDFLCRQKNRVDELFAKFGPDSNVLQRGHHRVASNFWIERKERERHLIAIHDSRRRLPRV